MAIKLILKYFCIGFFVSGMLPVTNVYAHALDPAFLDIREHAPGQYLVHWRTPEIKGEEGSVQTVPAQETPDPVFPDHCRITSRTATDPPQVFHVYSVTCSEPGLAGGIVRLESIKSIPAEVLVRYEPLLGSIHTQVLQPGDNEVSIPSAQSSRPLAILASYSWMGLLHIAKGVDHLLFVFVLMLMIQSLRSLIITITAFTVAHSVTLGFAFLANASLPPGPVETLIACSIVFLAAEIIRKRKDTLAYQRPWIVAFVFGLLHGFGFAGGLMNLGLPAVHAPLALLGFNLGVELGQVAFVVVLIGPLRWIRFHKHNMPRWAHALPAYAAGGIAVVWTLQRLSW